MVDRQNQTRQNQAESDKNEVSVKMSMNDELRYGTDKIFPTVPDFKLRIKLKRLEKKNY